MDIITSALNNGLGVDVIYLDFIEDFDRVAHARVVTKLKGIGSQWQFVILVCFISCQS